MALTPEQIQRRFDAPDRNPEFLRLWENLFPRSDFGQTLNIKEKQEKRNDFLNARDGRGSHPFGFAHLHLTRSFQAIAANGKMPEKPARDFALTNDALLPIVVDEATYPWTGLTGWVLYHRSAAPKVSNDEVDQSAVRLWLLQNLRIPVFRVVSVYLDNEYRLGASQNLSIELLKAHNQASYDFHGIVLNRLSALESEMEACDEQAKEDYPDATKATAQTIRSYYQIACLRNFIKKPPAAAAEPEANDSVGDGILRIRHLINDQKKPWSKVPKLKKETPLRDLDSSLIDDLPVGHQLQVNAAKSNQIAWSKKGSKALRDWLSLNADYPLYFFDLETYSPRLPIWAGTRMNQAVPFQFSLHTLNAEGGTAAHSEFIHDQATDPRTLFAETLMAAIPQGGPGRLFIYTNYEVQVLNELQASMDADPDIEASLKKRSRVWWSYWKEKIADLYVPFYQSAGLKSGFEAWLYHPAQLGSASIKKVVPAFTGRNPYADLAIQDGQTASDQYVKTLFGNDPSSAKEERLAELKAYCKVDTEVMVDLFDALERLF